MTIAIFLCIGINFFRLVHKIAKIDQLVRHVCLPGKTGMTKHGTTRLARDRSSYNRVFQYFSKLCRKNSGSY